MAGGASLGGRPGCRSSGAGLRLGVERSKQPVLLHPHQRGVLWEVEGERVSLSLRLLAHVDDDVRKGHELKKRAEGNSRQWRRRPSEPLRALRQRRHKAGVRAPSPLPAPRPGQVPPERGPP